MSKVNSILDIKWQAPLDGKIEALIAWLKSHGSIIVAYSGGVDSTFLAAAAHQVLGERSLAITADSPSLPRAEMQATREIAQFIGVAHEVVTTDEMSNANYLANPTNRCYYCKGELFTTLGKIVAERDYAVLVDGMNRDDLGDFRPGAKAAAELQVAHPLQELGFTKDDIRAASRAIGLPNADKPAAACLASRLPYGTKITEEALMRVEKSEAVLHELGFRQSRVRLHGRVARIEVPQEELGRVLEQRDTIIDGITAAGFQYVTLDLRGYRTGSMNEVINTYSSDVHSSPRSNK